MSVKEKQISYRGVPVRQPPKLKIFFSSMPVSIFMYLVIIFAIIYSSYSGAQSMGYNWQFYRMPQYLYSFTDDGFQFGEMMIGLGKTITLSTASLILALIIGLFIALLRLSGLYICSKVAICFIEFV